MKPDSLSECSAFVGIDWADRKHDVCVRSDIHAKSALAVLPNKVEYIDSWALELHERVPGLIAVAVELSRGSIDYALQKYDFFIIYPINQFYGVDYRMSAQPLLCQPFVSRQHPMR